MTGLDPNVYTVAWIAPLEIEAQAALRMFDQRHQGQFFFGRGNDYIFHAGEILGHNVILATLPAGQQYGTGSAAALASQVKRFFPQLWFGLLVGVAAGLPNLSLSRDIRLGDVLVALSQGDNTGLVAYDLGKETGSDGFQPLQFGHVLATTETVVRSAIGSIKLNSAPKQAEIFLPYYVTMKDTEHATGTFADPGQHRDRLYEVDENGIKKEAQRPRRPHADFWRTRVWYGSIGSGDKLMRNAKKRNELRDRYNIIGLEMEAAGVMSCIPVGVIRGVCDYGDEHKNKEWQPYASAMAASYAKAILSRISPAEITPTGLRRKPVFVVPFSPNTDFVGRDQISSELERLLPSDGKGLSAALCGIGGAGKSLIALEYVHRRRQKDSNCSVFWVHADKETTFLQDYKGIANELGLPESLNGEDLLRAVRYGIEAEACWVLVLDNADDLGLFHSAQLPSDDQPLPLSQFIPTGSNGTILWTSRDKLVERKLRDSSSAINVGRMTEHEARTLLERVSHRSIEQNEEDDCKALLAEIDRLPLAIYQAATYIRQTYTSIPTYLSKLRKWDKSWHVLQTPKDGPMSNGVLQTWDISIEHIRRENGMAYNILHVLAFLDGQKIPWQIVKRAGQFEAENHLGNGASGSSFIHGDTSKHDEETLLAVARLCDFFILSRLETSTEDGDFAMHKLLQQVIQHSLLQENRRSEGTRFAAAALQIVDGVFPTSRRETWKDCDKYLAHAMQIGKCTMLDNKKEQVASLLSRASRYLYDRGRWGEKEIVDEKALNLRKDVLDEKHPAVVQSIANLATTYHGQGRYEEAEQLRTKVFDLRERILLETRCEMLESKASLADTYHALGKYKEAEGIYSEVLEVRRQLLGEQHSDTVSSMASLASTYYAKGKYEDSRRISEEACTLQRQILGKDHLNTISSMALCATVCYAQAQYKEAEKIFDEVLALRQRILGERHPDTVSSRASIASTYHAQGLYDQAENEKKTVLTIRREILGDKHPDTISSLASLAAMYHDQGRYSEAENESRKVRALREELLGIEHPDTIESSVELAITYYAQGRYTEAEEIYENVLKLRRKLLPKTHPDTLRTMGLLATLYLSRGDYRNGEDLSTETYRLRRESLGKEHPDTISSLSELAAIHHNRQKYDLAVEQKKEVLALRRKRHIMLRGITAKLRQIILLHSYYEESFSVESIRTQSGVWLHLERFCIIGGCIQEQRRVKWKCEIYA
ncbi:Nephrocystin-3 [Colletotrichum siamense]|nr:Nephrocystin-3 [Colletotrichum siamense]